MERLPPLKPCGDEEALLQAPGEHAPVQTFDRQVVELHMRVALLNRFSQIRRPQTTPMAAMA